MRNVLLIRFGEVYLKGLNRPVFLKKLVDNIKRTLKPLGRAEVWLSDLRVYVAGDIDMVACAERVCKVFGVHSVSPAIEMEKDFEAIAAACVEMMRGKSGSFKVYARRSDKKFPIDSMEMQREIGGRVLDAYPELRVDVHNPQHKLCVEIRDRAYVYVDEQMAVGGMPYGTGGKAMLLLSGGIDSPVAGFQLMRRGVSMQAVHFYSFPYTSERAKDKVIELAKRIGEYGSGMLVHIVPFTHLQMEIHEKCPDPLGTLLMRRYMMRIAQRVAMSSGAQALVTGESLGQVASQTMESLAATDAVVTMPVFRPLIGMDKSEITLIAQRIDTYETSILPFEDCCTVFTPKHPTTRPKLADLESAELLLDSEALIQECIDGIEQVRTWAI